MDEELFKPGAKVELDRRQLRFCHWGFMLLAAGVLVSVSFLLITELLGEEQDPRSEQGKRAAAQRAMAQQAVGLGSLLLAQLPGCGLLLSAATTPRWRRASLVLLGASALELLLVLGISVLRPTMSESVMLMSLNWRIVDRLLVLASWLEFWSLAVVLGEFAIAGKSPNLLIQTETLSHFILAGAAASFAIAGWVLPKPVDPSDDAVLELLVLTEFFMALIVQIWLLNLLAGLRAASPRTD